MALVTRRPAARPTARRRGPTRADSERGRHQGAARAPPGAGGAPARPGRAGSRSARTRGRRRDRQSREREAHDGRSHGVRSGSTLCGRASGRGSSARRPRRGRDWRELAREADKGRELDPTLARLKGLLARERPVPERPGPLAVVAARLRDEAPDAASFRTPLESRAFREEMERRFDRGTLARRGRGKEAALARVVPDRLDRLCLARAWLDSQGEPARSEAHLGLAYRINDAQFAARRERDGHEHDGLTWGL